MQSLMLFVMIIAMAAIIVSVLLALQTAFTKQNEIKTSLLLLGVAAALIFAVLYVAKTSGMMDNDAASLVGMWSLALVPKKMFPRKKISLYAAPKVRIQCIVCRAITENEWLCDACSAARKELALEKGRE